MSNLVCIERREFIKYQLRLRGSSLTAISRELGVSITTVSQVSSGHRVSKRVLEAIAEKIGVSVDYLSSLNNKEFA
jgi:transcriptional regulator with XRE-family HTH domain